MDGDLAVVGSPRANSAFPDTGAAYVFRWNGAVWTQQQKLTNTDVSPSNPMTALAGAARGNLIVVGSYNDDEAAPDAGGAYVFGFSTIQQQWYQQQELTASDARTGDEFGHSVATDAEVIVVGANNDDHDNSDPTEEKGSAYVYRFNGVIWEQEQKLTASDAGRGHQFGSSVAVDSGVIAVSAPNHNVATGAVYVFRFNGVSWIEEHRISASDAATGQRFGTSLALRGDILVVGAPGDDCQPGIDCGAAYVFRLHDGAWTEEAKIQSSDLVPNVFSVVPLRRTATW